MQELANYFFSALPSWIAETKKITQLEPAGLLRLYSCVEYFFSLVVSALRADTVRHFGFVALGAFDVSGSRKLPHSPALTHTRF